MTFGMGSPLWFKLPSMPDDGRLMPFAICSSTQYTSCSFATVDGKLFMIGGWQATSGPIKGRHLASSTVSYFDLKRWEWKNTAPLNVARARCATGVIDDKIYICGGLIDDYYRPTLSTEVYDPMTETWKLVASMPTPKKVGKMVLSTSTVLDGKLHVVTYQTVENHGGMSRKLVGVVYDPRTDIWTKMPDGLNFKWFGRLVTFNGKLYCPQGILPVGADGIRYDGMGEWNPSKDTWELSEGSRGRQRVPEYVSVHRLLGFVNKSRLVVLDEKFCVVYISLGHEPGRKELKFEIKDMAGDLVGSKAFLSCDLEEDWDKRNLDDTMLQYEIVRL